MQHSLCEDERTSAAAERARGADRQPPAAVLRQTTLISARVSPTACSVFLSAPTQLLSFLTRELKTTRVKFDVGRKLEDFTQ